jgi:hypothetical protein
MSVELYPVPGAEPHLESFVEPFLESTVKDEGLDPEKQFLILLFGESASEQVEPVREIARAHDTTTAQALEIGQLRVTPLEERRLNTFTTSLLYNLLEINSDSDLRETLEGDAITDEDGRKIDYYLPRLTDSVSEMVETQQTDIETALETMFPVELENEAARTMNTRLDNDIVTEQTIMDHLLLAAGAEEAPDDVSSLVRYLREEKIDDTGYLSKGADASGYKRVFSLSYNLNEDRFSENFQTAQELYNQGATSQLFQILNQVDTDIDLSEVYKHESPIERLITDQFAGNDREIAQRILRTINGTRVVENNRDRVKEEYEGAREKFKGTVENAREQINELQAHNSKFDERKIEITTGEVDQFETLVQRIDEVDSTIIKYLFGFDRKQRTSVFSTLTEQVDQYSDRLQDHRTNIDERIERLNQFEQTRDELLDKIDEVYDQIEDTSIEIELPPRQSVKQDLESQWNEEVTDLKASLPPIDFEAEDDTIESKIEQWDSKNAQTMNELEPIREPVDVLESFGQKIETIEEKRSEARRELESIDELMEDAQ